MSCVDGGFAVFRAIKIIFFSRSDACFGGSLFWGLSPRDRNRRLKRAQTPMYFPLSQGQERSFTTWDLIPTERDIGGPPSKKHQQTWAGFEPTISDNLGCRRLWVRTLPTSVGVSWMEWKRATTAPPCHDPGTTSKALYTTLLRYFSQFCVLSKKKLHKPPSPNQGDMLLSLPSPSPLPKFLFPIPDFSFFFPSFVILFFSVIRDCLPDKCGEKLISTQHRRNKSQNTTNTTTRNASQYIYIYIFSYIYIYTRYTPTRTVDSRQRRGSNLQAESTRKQQTKRREHRGKNEGISGRKKNPGLSCRRHEYHASGDNVCNLQNDEH